MTGARTAWQLAARLPAWINAGRAIHAGNVALAAILTLSIAFIFDLQNTFWALLTVPLIVRPQSGATVWRSAARIGGTLLGCFVALFLVGFFAQLPVAMIAALSLWLFGVGFWARLESGSDAYAYAVAGLTTLVIVLDTGSAAGEVYTFALARTTETFIAVASVFVVLLVVFPHSAADDVAQNIRAAREVAFKIGREAVAMRPVLNVGDHKTAIALLAVIATDLRARKYERSRRNDRLGQAIAVAQDLTRIVVEAEGVRRTLSEIDPKERVAALKEAREWLERVLARASEPQESSRCCLLEAESVEDVRSSIEAARLADHIRQSGTFGDASLRQAAALFQLRMFAGTVSDFLKSEAALSDPGSPPTPFMPVANRYPDLIAACETGLRPMIVFLSCAALWLSTGWTDGGLLALIASGFTLVLPSIIPRPVRLHAGKLLAQGFSVGAVISLLLMACLSSLEGFSVLALLLGSAVFVIFYVAGDLPRLPLAIGSTVMIAIALQPSNTPLYSPISLVNEYAGLALAPVALISGLTILFPENQAWLKRHLRRGTSVLLARATAEVRPIDEHVFSVQMIDILGDYGADLDADDPHAAHLIDRARMARLAGQECYRMRRLGASGDLPPELGSLAGALVSTVRKAVEDPSSAIRSDAVFQDLVRAVGEWICKGDCEDRQYLAVFHFAASAGLCRILVRSGDLSPTPRVQAERVHAS
ncbi:FUSC family protein [Roseibium sp. M-1]